MKKQAEIFNRAITDQETWSFNVDADGVYLINVLARAKNWRQNIRRLFNDDDLGVWLDNYPFAELAGKKREFAGLGSWNGNKLANKEKAVVFILPLLRGQHQLRFWVDGAPFLQSIEIYQPGVDEQDIQLPLPTGVAAADIVFKNVPLAGLSTISRNGAVKNYEAASDRLGIRAWELQRPGQPALASIKIKLGQEAVKYKLGRVQLYQDIILSTEVNLRALPNEEAPILSRLSDGAELEIVAEKVKGEYVLARSDIWHEVIWQDKRGFILSSFVEIEGQERERIIELVKAKCRERKVDANIMLAIAQRESHFKPYAVSERGAQGVFQLVADTAVDMGVADRLDFYQNIDGGVRYYKWIEGKIIGRGNILEKRLVAWHSGIGRVPRKGPVDYGRLPHGAEANRFIKDVLENLKRKNWERFILIPSFLLAVFLAYSAGFLSAKDNRAGTFADILYAKELAGAVVGSYEGSQLRTTGESVVFNQRRGKLKKMLVRDLRNENDWPYTQFIYWTDQGEFREMLSGYFADAGWLAPNDFPASIFLITREEGKYSPVAFYRFNEDGEPVFTKIKFIEKDGRARDDISRFDFLTDGGSPVLRAAANIETYLPFGVRIVIYKDYQYDAAVNAFKEINSFKKYEHFSTKG